MNLDDSFFVHETTPWRKSTGEKFTKIELAALFRLNTLDAFKTKVHSLTPVSLTEVYACARKENSQHLIVQLNKLSNDKQTEIAKGFFRYNNGIYFFRIYKFVGNDYAKLEITKVPLGQRAWMHPVKAVNGLIDAMKHVVRGLETYLLPHYKHSEPYETLDEFRKKFL